MNTPDHGFCIWLAVVASVASIYGCVCIFACLLNLAGKQRRRPR